MSHPDRMLRTQATQLIELGKLVTTDAKARQLRRYVVSLLNKAQANNLSSYRALLGLLYTDASIAKVRSLPKNASIKKFKIGFRKGDSAAMTMLVLDIPNRESGGLKNEAEGKTPKRKVTRRVPAS